LADGHIDRKAAVAGLRVDEAFFLVLNGHLGVLPMVTDFFVPVLIGNIIGGTALFALIAYAQVMKEI
jgi:formate-nitrite transporter family protein